MAEVKSSTGGTNFASVYLIAFLTVFLLTFLVPIELMAVGLVILVIFSYPAFFTLSILFRKKNPSAVILNGYAWAGCWSLFGAYLTYAFVGETHPLLWGVAGIAFVRLGYWAITAK